LGGRLSNLKSEKYSPLLLGSFGLPSSKSTRGLGKVKSCKEKINYAINKQFIKVFIGH